MSTRWSSPVSVSNALTPLQAQRVQALRAAREVVEEASQSSIGSGGRITCNNDRVMEVAAWIMTGEQRRAGTVTLNAGGWTIPGQLRASDLTVSDSFAATGGVPCGDEDGVEDDAAE